MIAPGEEKFIVSAIELGQVQVREIMVPRPDMHVLPVESTLDEVMRAFATTQRSRIPVYRGTEDQMLGFVHIKDMLWVLLDRERRLEEGVAASAFDLRRVLREILIVSETKPASELLAELRTRRVGMALVVDEFGSILGLVTVEDILEQVVGEIHDEFDVVEGPMVLPDGGMIFDAAITVRDRMPPAEVTRRQRRRIAEDEFDVSGKARRDRSNLTAQDRRAAVIAVQAQHTQVTHARRLAGHRLDPPDSSGCCAAA